MLLSSQASSPCRVAKPCVMSMIWKLSLWTSPSQQWNVPKKQRAYYSGKQKSHTHKSQVIVQHSSKRILSTSYGKGRAHDFKVLKHSRCASTLFEDTELYADSGFQGVAKLHPKSCTPHKRWRGRPLSQEQKVHNHIVAKVRILAEHVIRRLKVFRILKETYRHRRRRFALRLNLIAALYNHDLAAL
jgi:hypothetical protein